MELNALIQATQQFDKAIRKYLQRWKNMKIQYVDGLEQKNDVMCVNFGKPSISLGYGCFYPRENRETLKMKP